MPAFRPPWLGREAEAYNQRLLSRQPRLHRNRVATLHGPCGEGSAGVPILEFAGARYQNEANFEIAILERRASKLDRHAALSLCFRIGSIRKPLRTFRSDAQAGHARG
jgi:hypothetical protein